MRHTAIAKTLVTKGAPLFHPKSMLFINDDQGQSTETHPFLEERMRPDHDGHLGPSGDRIERRLPGATGESTREQRDR